MADRYSFSLTTFSPSGKLVQIEYALSAVNSGVTSIGIKGNSQALERKTKRRHGRSTGTAQIVPKTTTSLSCLYMSSIRNTISPPHAIVLISNPLVLTRLLTIVATNGIVVATEKKAVSTLIDDSSLEKVAIISSNIGMVYSGMGPDYRVLVNKARKAAQAYKRVYMEEPPTAILVKEIASVMQEFTQSG